jgi:glycerol-3-phosphate cytidylyltransferase
MKHSNKIIYTAGSFDMLHVGHTNILKNAKKLGDYLIVGVSTDRLIKKQKFLSPVIKYADRVSVIKDLKYVDKVIKQDNFFDIEQLRPYHIDIIVLGSDWKNVFFQELYSCLKELNIKIIYLPYTKRLSSSSIKEKIIRNCIPIIRSQTKRSK